MYYFLQTPMFNFPSFFLTPKLNLRTLPRLYSNIFTINPRLLIVISSNLNSSYKFFYTCL